MKDVFLILSIGVLFSETLSAIVGLSLRRRLSNSFWSYFPLYLVCICIIDWIGWLTRTMNLSQLNYFIYTFIGMPMEYMFFIWLMSKLIKSKKEINLFYISIGIYVLSWIVDFFLLSEHRFSFFSFSGMIGSILLVILVLIYLYIVLASDYILVFTKTLDFWVILGVITYYLLSFPYYGTWNILLNNYKNIFEFYQLIVYILSITMYILFTIGLLWQKKN